jgi:hypothetical protein
MDFIKKETNQMPGKKLPPQKPLDMYHFCNACGNKFKVERADARFCNDICRSASYSVAKGIIAVPHNITPDDAMAYDQIVLKLKDEKGTVVRALFENDGAGIFTRVKKELKRTGDEETDKANESKEQVDGEQVAMAKAAKKGIKVPKNDKHLIPGKKNSKGEPVKKKGAAE